MKFLVLLDNFHPESVAIKRFGFNPLTNIISSSVCHYVTQVILLEANPSGAPHGAVLNNWSKASTHKR
jgi:hypothetical protein